MNLGREFPRRFDDYRRRTWRPCAMQPVDDWNKKGRGLATAGFSRRDYIASTKDYRNRTRLDWSGLMVATVADRTMDFGRERKDRKRQTEFLRLPAQFWPER